MAMIVNPNIYGTRVFFLQIKWICFVVNDKPNYFCKMDWTEQ